MKQILKFFGFARKPIHLDFASTTPVAPEVLKLMMPYFSHSWANPSALYSSGVTAKKAIEEARVRVSRILNIRPAGVMFTSGGTEANNHALYGYIEALRKKGRSYEDMEILTTTIEHPSIR